MKLWFSRRFPIYLDFPKCKSFPTALSYQWMSFRITNDFNGEDIKSVIVPVAEKLTKKFKHDSSKFEAIFPSYFRNQTLNITLQNFTTLGNLNSWAQLAWIYDIAQPSDDSKRVEMIIMGKISCATVCRIILTISFCNENINCHVLLYSFRHTGFIKNPLLSLIVIRS